MPQPPSNDAAAQQLIDVYRQAQRDLEQKLAAIIDDPSRAGQASKIRKLIATTKATLAGLEQATADWLTATLPEIHALGGQFAAEALGHDFAWTLPHQEAVQELATRTFTDVAENLQDIDQSTRAALRSWAEDSTRAGLLESQTAVQAGKDMARVAADQGMFSVTYSNGATHAMADYAETVVRTTTATAYNRGSVTQCREDGIEYVQYADGPECGVDGHDDDTLADGLIVALDDVIDISHPNCRRAMLPVVDGAVPDGVDASVGPERTPLAAPAPKATRQPRQARQPRTPRTAAS